MPKVLINSSSFSTDWYLLMSRVEAYKMQIAYSHFTVANFMSDVALALFSCSKIMTVYPVWPTTDEANIYMKIINL